MEALVIFLTFLALMALGVPIGTSLGIAAVVTVYQFDLGIAMLGVNFSSGIASFPLLAIPFFVLAGVILEKAGLAASIARFFELLVGKAVGGLAMVAVMTCMFWGALSGSGPATTAARGPRRSLLDDELDALKRRVEGRRDEDDKNVAES